VKKEERLYRLIQTLTAAEKKYIRLNINKFRPNESSKTLLLFDSLNKQKKYNPHSINEAYATAGYTSSYLAADRHQLYDIILEGLSDVHAKSTTEIQISIGYEKAVLLFEKKLFTEALKQIERVVKIAKGFEAYGSLINLYHLKQRILKINYQFDDALEVIEEQTKLWEGQSRVNEYIKLHYKSIKLRVELAKARSLDNLAKLDEFIHHPLLQQGPPENSFQEQFHYWETYCNYYFIQDDKHKELEANYALVKLIDSYPVFKENDPLNHLIFSTRILAIQRNLFPQLFIEHLAQYRALNKGFKKQRPQAESIIFIFSYNYELDYYIHHKDWDKGLKLLPDMLVGLKNYDAFIREPLKVTAYYRIAYLYFLKQKYLEALDALEKVIEDYPATLRPDVYSFALLLKIMSHYELGNFRLMPYLIKTAQYHIKKRNRLFQTEKVAIHYLKKLSKVSNRGKDAAIFAEFDAAIEDLVQNNEYERRSLEIFDFVIWIKSKKDIK